MNPKQSHATCPDGRQAPKKRILFVCLGNICRSPTAEAVARAEAITRGCEDDFEFDSAGLYAGHAGELPDSRMRAHARRRGYELAHRSRPVSESDFFDFDLILAMDDSNFDALRHMAPTLETQQKVARMIDFAHNRRFLDAVPDPYYGGADGFELVLDLLEDACGNLVDSLSSDSTTN